jgi:hypothetical protein
MPSRFSLVDLYGGDERYPLSTLSSDELERIEQERPDLRDELELLRGERAVAHDLLSGFGADRQIVYVVEGSGYGSAARSLASLEEALVTIEDELGLRFDEERGQLRVWEVLPSGHRKVVWAAAGWKRREEMERDVYDFDGGDTLPCGKTLNQLALEEIR